MSTTHPPATTIGTPQSASGAQPGALQPSVPIGTRVRLKFSPDSDETGEVADYERGRVRVLWPDWNREGKYFACSLIPAEDRAVNGNAKVAVSKSKREYPGRLAVRDRQQASPSDAM
jgi:hypothetical protein